MRGQSEVLKACPQRSQYPLLKEYTLKHNIRAPIRSIPYLRDIGISESTDSGV